MVNTYRPALRWASISVLLFVLCTQFVNCGQYGSGNTDSSSTTTLNCNAVTCVIPDPDNLSIKANIGGGSQYGLSADIVDFNLGGDCNEAGYPYNTIYWELQLNGTVVRNSNMIGMNAGNTSATVNTKCVNGRFSLYVNMGPISSDNVNRTGCLTSTGVRSQYDLYINIIGMPASTGSGYQNTLTGRTHVALLAQ